MPEYAAIAPTALRGYRIRMPIEFADQRRGLFMALESLAGTAAILLDADGNLEHANPQVCDLLDCSGEGMLRDRWKTIGALFALPSATEP